MVQNSNLLRCKYEVFPLPMLGRRRPYCIVTIFHLLENKKNNRRSVILQISQISKKNRIFPPFAAYTVVMEETMFNSQKKSQKQTLSPLVKDGSLNCVDIRFYKGSGKSDPPLQKRLLNGARKTSSGFRKKLPLF